MFSSQPQQKDQARKPRFASQLLVGLAHFTYQQAMSCLFPVFIFLLLALSPHIPIPFLHRYDVLLLGCLLMQWIMYRTGLETKDEVKVIALFHIIGLALELFKVHMGSWAYPEAAWTKFFGVPLYSGFMYASVASYLCQAWRRMDVRLLGWPQAWLTVPLGTAVYLNFFVHHFWIDIRWWLTGAIFLVFLPTFVQFRVQHHVLKMPLSLSFFLIGFFVWIAENIATFFGAWKYPNQAETWHLVGLGKISSWFLLVIISFLIVAQLKHVKERLN
ncbi:MAG TPA: DUF817 domain-containing protein [Bacilli bacterium]|nr:DUF817 domain-containing protein [Bacilli bacterium]